MLYQSEYYGVCSLDISLSHHGIKGQRWGRRRFQNDDGSLTPAGRERYLTSDGQLNERGQKELKRDKRKFSKLSDNADVGVQRSKYIKYAKYAKISKQVAETAGLIAVASIASKTRLNQYAKFRGDQLTKPLNDINALEKADGRYTWDALKRIADKPNWGVNNPKATAAYDKIANDYLARSSAREAKFNEYLAKSEKVRNTLQNIDKLRDVTGKVAVVGAAAGAGAYAYNVYRKNKVGKRLTREGHAEAVRERDEYEERMKRKYGKNWH